jgi:hypothetical protein
MRPSFEKACDRFHIQLGSEFTFGETIVRSLYSDNEFVGYGDSRGNLASNDYISVIDLMSINRKLMNDATILGNNKEGKLQKRAWLATTYMAVGRGGESTFVDTADWTWHPRYEILDTQWTELKTMEKYAMPVVPDKKHFLPDFFHSVGSFWSVDDGLYRDENDPDQAAIAFYLFPDLHGFTDNGVTKKITSVIRENLPNGCPTDILNSYSAKSLHKGSITELMTYPSLNGTDVCGRSGHATGTNLDAYDDKSFIVRGIRGVKALAHYSNVDANIKVPRFECLGAHVTGTVDALLKELFLVSVPVFLPGRSLHVVLRTCGAS